MFSRISDLAKSLEAKKMAATFPPSHFRDPLALQTEWTCCSPGGEDFKSFQLHRISPSHWEFRRVGNLVLKARSFAVLGLGLLGYAWLKYPEMPTVIEGRVFKAILFCGGLFTLAGLVLYLSSTVRSVFDKETGYFHKCRQKKTARTHPSRYREHADLSRIHALQLIARSPQGKYQPSFLFEINMVLDDASRLNVIAHGDLEAIRKDATALSGFLGKPLWDSI
jgi:hypothetical protein